MTKNGNYSRSEIELKCESALNKLNGPMLFYGEQFLRYEDVVKSETDVLRTEVVAKFVNDNLEHFKSIPTQERKNYKMKSHKGDYSKDTVIEKIIAKKMFSISNRKKDPVSFANIGKIIDYETPLMSVRSNRRIDLLSQNDETKKVYILELKKEESRESLLRCVLEAFTYKKLMNKKYLFKSFNIPNNYELVAAPLVFVKGTQYEQMQEIIKGKRPELKKLIKNLDCSGPFYIRIDKDGNYVIDVE